MSYCKSGPTAFPGSAGCQRCDAKRLATLVKKTGDWTDGFGGMIVCPTCGNKRCPKATFHGNDCTGSNAPNQPGSSYQICCCDWGDMDRWENTPALLNPACTVEHEVTP
jgi:hypothetical protein